jgi:TolA-binding protein
MKSLNRRLSVMCVLAAFVAAEAVFAAARPKTRVEATGPSQQEYYSTIDQSVSAEDLRKANQIRLQTIESIKKLLVQKNIKGSRRFELYLRLGELYAEGHDYIRDEETEQFNQNYQKWVKSGKKGAEPKAVFKRSRTQLANAAEAFRKLVREFPREPRTASALYSLGKTLARLEDDSSVMYFEKLIKDHKKSPLIPDAHLSMGDFYFEKHQIPKAITSYKNFIKFRNHSAYPYGVYKLGWAYYNATPRNDEEERDFIAKSVTSFKLAIKLADDDQRRRIKRIDLRQEAIKDLIMVWAETGETEEAWAYFKTIGEKKFFYDLLERLGTAYADQGKSTKAVELLVRLAEEAPTRENTPRIYERLLSLYDGMGQTQKVVDSLNQMNKLFIKGSPWTVRYAKDDQLVADIKKLVEFSMHRYGTLYHQRAQKADSQKYLASASLIYAAYLEAFPNSKNAYEIRYYYADTLVAFKKNEAAADQYTLVVNADPKGKYLKESAINAVAALNRLDQSNTYSKLPPAGQVPKAIAIPRVKAKLIAAMDQFVKVLPHDKAGDPMRFTAAQIYFDYGQYDESMKRFNSIVADIPNSKQADVSLRMILAYRVEKKDWQQTISLAQSYLAKTNLSGELRAYVVGVMRNAMFNDSLDLEKSEKYEAAARSFVALHKAFPNEAGLSDKSLFNASVNFFRAGLLEDAIAVNIMLIEKHPKSDLVPQSIANVGQTYEALGQYEKAASYYRQFAFQYPKDKLASRALYSAASLYKGFNQTAEAEKLFQRFVQLYPYNRMASDVRLEVAKLQENQGQMKAAMQSYRSLGDSKDIDLALLGSAKSAVLQMTLDQSTDGRKALQLTMQKLSAKDAPAALEARAVVAEALFKDAHALFQSTKGMPVSSAKTLEADVSRKQRNLEILARRYKEVMSIESPEYTVASLYRLGELHEDLAEKLFAVSAPDGATQVDVSKFKSMLEKVAFPLREEAYKFYETAYKRSQEVETFTAWTRKTYDKMAELAPDKNPAVYEIEADPSYMVNKLSLGQSTESLAH